MHVDNDRRIESKLWFTWTSSNLELLHKFIEKCDQHFEELCQIVEEAIELYRKDGKQLPPATSGRDFGNRMQQVA